MQSKTAIPETSPRAAPALRAAASRRLGDRRLLLIVLLSLLAGALAYQAPVSTSIPIGVLGDQLFLPRGEGLDKDSTDAGRWYGDELTDHARSGRSRWTRQNAEVVLPGLGAAGDLTLSIRAQGWPADALHDTTRQPTVTVFANGARVGTFQPRPEWADYQLALPPLAPPGDMLRIRLASSAVFTGTQSAPNADNRPKGIRVEAIGVRGADLEGLTLPAPLSLALLALEGLLAYLAPALLLRRPTAAFVLAIVVVSGSALALALARAWAAALLPWAVAGLALLVLLGLRHPLGRLLGGLAERYARGQTLGTGLVVALAVWLVYEAVRIALSVGLPTTEMLRDSFPDSLIYAMLAIGLLALTLVRGRDGVPRLARWLVAFVGSRRGATALLALFLAVWLGYEAWAIGWLPYVGHADYADNAVVARNLAAGRGWVVDYVTQFYNLNNTGVTRPQETWPLLQPIWIAPFFALFGPSNWAAKIPNLIFMLALGLAVFAVGARLWDRRVGLIATVILLTSSLFFFLAIYTTTDLAFTVFAFGAVYLLYRSAKDEGRLSQFKTQHSTLKTPELLGSAVLTGLMLLQKPSGALIALGMGLWLVWRVWRSFADDRRPTTDDREQMKDERHLRSSFAFRRWSKQAILKVCVWGLGALLLLSPYLARNVLTFGRPFYSTESKDAWVLSYGDWEDIYKVYTPQQGLSETGGVPAPNWILRWGFDRTLFKLTTQLKAVRDYLAPPWRNLPLNLSDLLSGRNDRALLFGVGAWLSLLGLVALLRRRRDLAGLLLLAFGPYALFLVTYWHADEERYFVVLMPWLALLAAYALWRIYDRIAVVGRGGWAPAGLVLVAVALLNIVQPSWPDIANKLQNEPNVHAADLDAYAWLRANTPPGDVVMTRVPWQLNWTAERPALMVPNTRSAATFLKLARYYRARYLVVDTVQNPSEEARRVVRELIQNQTLKLVYTTPPYESRDDKGNPQNLVTRVYQFNGYETPTAERRP